MQVEMGDSVAVRYTGRLDSGEVFDTNEDAQAEALVFVVGAQQVIAGFERAVLGLKQGESRTVRIPPEEAYGPRDEKLIARLDRALFEGGTVSVGHHVDLEDEQGNVFHADVVGFDDKTVTVDLNHHLAGQALTFDIRVEGVEKA
jgi:peptidylprolyl isomerase